MLSSSDANSSLIPAMSLTMQGRGQLAVYDPVIVISTQVGSCYNCLVMKINIFTFLSFLQKLILSRIVQHELVYCLAVIRSAELNIIGRKLYYLTAIYFESVCIFPLIERGFMYAPLLSSVSQKSLTEGSYLYATTCLSKWRWLEYRWGELELLPNLCIKTSELVLKLLVHKS